MPVTVRKAKLFPNLPPISGWNILWRFSKPKEPWKNVFPNEYSPLLMFAWRGYERKTVEYLTKERPDFRRHVLRSTWGQTESKIRFGSEPGRPKLSDGSAAFLQLIFDLEPGHRPKPSNRTEIRFAKPLYLFEQRRFGQGCPSLYQVKWQEEDENQPIYSYFSLLPELTGKSTW